VKNALFHHFIGTVLCVRRYTSGGLRLSPSLRCKLFCRVSGIHLSNIEKDFPDFSTLFSAIKPRWVAVHENNL